MYFVNFLILLNFKCNFHFIFIWLGYDEQKVIDEIIYNELYINDNIVTTLLECGGSPFIKNLHNIAPIHNIINLYNHKLLSTILTNPDVKDIGFDLKDDIDRLKDLLKKDLKLASSSLRQLNLFCLDKNITNDKLSQDDLTLLNNPNFNAAYPTFSPLTALTTALTSEEEKIKDIFTVIFENIYKALIIKTRMDATIKVMESF